MNIFYLDKDLDKNAEYHIDKHVTKMQLELAQLLSTAIIIDRNLGYVPRKLDKVELGQLAPLDGCYKPTHPNHPCAIWVRSSLENYEYTWLLCHALNQEALYRGYKDHKSWHVAKNLPQPLEIESCGFQKPALAMPDEYKSDCAVESYRTYYKNDKRDIATWKRETILV